jgi:hypothetical protein
MTKASMNEAQFTLYCTPALLVLEATSEYRFRSSNRPAISKVLQAHFTLFRKSVRAPYSEVFYIAQNHSLPKTANP